MRGIHFVWKKGIVGCITLLLFFCNSPNDQSDTVLKFHHIIDNYFNLKVGNSWTYVTMNRNSMGEDSSIMTVEITGNNDSVWYFNIVDSVFYSKELGGRRSSSYCDTCTRSNDSLKCTKHTYDQWFFCNPSGPASEGRISVDGCPVDYAIKELNFIVPTPTYGCAYIKNVGLISYYSAIGPMTPGALSWILIKFNGLENDFNEHLPEVVNLN